MTFIEMMISISVFSMVGLFVATLMIAVARQSRQSLSAIPAEGHAYRAMDAIRVRLLPASIGSATVAEEGRRVTFVNPPAGVTSALEYDPDDRVLRYFQNSTDADGTVIARVQNTQFAVIAPGRQVRVTVTTPSRDTRGNNTSMTYSEVLTLRN